MCAIQKLISIWSATEGKKKDLIEVISVSCDISDLCCIRLEILSEATCAFGVVETTLKRISLLGISK